MNMEARRAALLLDRAAAETNELEWIPPLAFLKERAEALAAADVAADGSLLALCGHAVCAAEKGIPLPPDLPRRILASLLDAVCISKGSDALPALRERCGRCADFLRVARRAKPLFKRALRTCPEAVQREETAALSAALAEMEAMFDQLLEALNNAIRAEEIRLRVREAREAHAALMELPLPTQPPIGISWDAPEAKETGDPAILREKTVPLRGYVAEADVL